jgi:D-ribulokinase
MSAAVLANIADYSAIVAEAGSETNSCRRKLRRWLPEQPNEAFVRATCAALVRNAVTRAAIPPAARSRGMGFDATCSLAVLDVAANPLTVSAMGTR